MPSTDGAHGLAGDDEFRALADRLCAGVGRVGGMRSSVLVLTDGAASPIVAGAHGLSVARIAQQARRLVDPHALDRALQHRRTQISCDGTIVVPLTGAAGPVGAVVGRRRRSARELDASTRTALEGAGRITAVAIEEHRATVRHETDRRHRERLEMAQNLHATVVQRLFGAALVLSANGPLADVERERIAEEVRGALSDLRSQLIECAECAPLSVGMSFADALRALSEEPGVHVTVTGPPPRLANRQDAATRSVLAEAVRNARKHAGPCRVEVAVHTEAELLRLDVVNTTTDTPPAGHVPGVGLRLAAAEALEADGLLQHGPQGPDHWHVQLTVPQHGAAS